MEDHELFLHCVKEGLYREIVEILSRDLRVLEKKSICGHGEGPLHLAVERGDYVIVELLLKNGADRFVNALDYLSKTPLHYCLSTNGNSSIVELLLNHGADLYARDSCNRTSISYAAQNGNINAINILIQRMDTNQIPDMINCKSNWGWSPLLYAVKINKELTALLLKNGADVNAENLDGSTALHLAVNSEIVDLLLKAGAFIDSQNNDKQTALHIAAKRGDKELSCFLKEKGANLSLLDYQGKTPLDLEKEFEKRTLKKKSPKIRRVWGSLRSSFRKTK